MAERVRRGRKLLIASLGVAAVSYVACGSNTETSGNLVGPPPNDSGVGGSQGTGGSATGDSGSVGGGPVGNLMPFPTDSGAGGLQDSGTGTGGSGGSGEADAADGGPVIDWDVVANLLPPPPPDE